MCLPRTTQEQMDHMAGPLSPKSSEFPELKLTLNSSPIDKKGPRLFSVRQEPLPAPGSYPCLLQDLQTAITIEHPIIQQPN